MNSNTALKTIGAFVFGLCSFVQKAPGSDDDPNAFKKRHPDVVFFAGAIGSGLFFLGFKPPGEYRDED